MRKSFNEIHGLGYEDALAKGLTMADKFTVQERLIPTNKYQRECKGILLDVYDVLHAFKVSNSASQHAIKKLLATGQRGYKDTIQDLTEARDSIDRAIELEMNHD